MFQSQPRGTQVQKLQVLTASVHDVRQIANVLRGVNFVDRAVVSISASGLQVTVEEARSLLGIAYIPKQMFDEEYTYHSSSSEDSQQADETTLPDTFEIRLDALLECLNIFGSAGSSSASSNLSSLQQRGRGGWKGRSGEDGEARGGSRFRDEFKGGAGEGKGTAMRMTYGGNGYPLTVLLVEDASGPKTTVEITTMNAEPHLELPFIDDDKIAHIIMKSSWLHDALSELDSTCDKISVTCFPIAGAGGERRTNNRQSTAGNASSERPPFRLQGYGTFGSAEMDYPNNGDVLELFQYTADEPTRFTYRYHHISRTLKALGNSVKTSLRLSEDGVLSLQFMMPEIKGVENVTPFIEFKCMALDEEE